MKPTPPKLSIIVFIAIVLIIPVLTIACGAMTRLATINLHQSQIDEIVKETANINSTDGWGFIIQSAEIKDGFIRIYGDYTPQGSPMASGSLDTVLKVEDGSLKGETARVTFQGFAAPDQALKIVSNMVAQQIGKYASEGKRQAVFESATVEEGILKIVLRYRP
jgi:hypothetical protein